MSSRVWVAVLAALLIGVGTWGAVKQWEAEDVRNAALRREALARDREEAERDSTRELVLGVMAESVRVFQRRAVQGAVRADSLDRALGVERMARVQLAAEIGAFRAKLSAPTAAMDVRAPDTRATETTATDSSRDVRRAVFDERREPYRVHAEVELPRPPGLGVMDVSVEVDSMVLDVRVGCGAPGGNGLNAGDGVRAATVSVMPPAWARVRLTRVEQDERVCSPAVCREGGGRDR